MERIEKREIKFRAWVEKDIIEGKPATMYPIVRYDWGIERPFDQVLLLTSQVTLYNINLEYVNLMQYTGLKDKNGKEAYWDDIVSDGTNPPFVIIPDYHLLARLSEIVFEVIGNIYENPELLGTREV